MNVKCKVSNKPDEISKATHIILPVGSFFTAMQNIKQKKLISQFVMLLQKELKF